MSGSPFDRTNASIPVTVVSSAVMPVPADGVAVVRLQPAAHEHAPGSECPGCAAAGDVRAMLFDLLIAAREEQRPLHRVIIDASALGDSQPVLARLDPRTAAIGLRDHTVLRSFHLQDAV